MRQLIQEYGLFHIVRGTDLDAALAWVAYSRTLEIEWTFHGVNYAFVLYDWNYTEVTEFTTVVHTIRRRGRPVDVTLSAELVNWHQMPQQSIGEA